MYPFRSNSSCIYAAQGPQGSDKIRMDLSSGIVIQKSLCSVYISITIRTISLNTFKNDSFSLFSKGLEGRRIANIANILMVFAVAVSEGCTLWSTAGARQVPKGLCGKDPISNFRVKSSDIVPERGPKRSQLLEGVGASKVHHAAPLLSSRAADWRIAAGDGNIVMGLVTIIRVGSTQGCTRVARQERIRVGGKDAILIVRVARLDNGLGGRRGYQIPQGVGFSKVIRAAALQPAFGGQGTDLGFRGGRGGGSNNSKEEGGGEHWKRARGKRIDDLYFSWENP